jgi:tetratricopeptide (TPR) repeat protein
VRRRALAASAAALLLAALGLALRHDLDLLARARGERLLRAGAYREAAALLSAATERSPGSLELAFDAGCALYRAGEFQAAGSRFAAAAGSPDPVLRGAARYNLGNCAFRRGEMAAATQRAAAGALFSEAQREYRGAIAGDSGAQDARHNLALADARLASLAGPPGSSPGRAKAPSPGSAQGRETGAGAQKADGTRAAETDGAKGAKAGERAGESAAPRPGEERGSRAGRAKSHETGTAGRSGKPREQLTRAAAEALLSEARGREGSLAAPAARGDRGRQVRPEKDW